MGWLTTKETLTLCFARASSSELWSREMDALRETCSCLTGKGVLRNIDTGRVSTLCLLRPHFSTIKLLIKCMLPYVDQPVSVPLGDNRKVVHMAAPNCKPHSDRRRVDSSSTYSRLQLRVRWFPRLWSAVYFRVVSRCLRPGNVYSKTGARNFHLTSVVAIESSSKPHSHKSRG